MSHARNAVASILSNPVGVDVNELGAQPVTQNASITGLSASETPEEILQQYMFEAVALYFAVAHVFFGEDRTEHSVYNAPKMNTEDLPFMGGTDDTFQLTAVWWNSHPTREGVFQIWNMFDTTGDSSHGHLYPKNPEDIFDTGNTTTILLEIDFTDDENYSFSMTQRIDSFAVWYEEGGNQSLRRVMAEIKDGELYFFDLAIVSIPTQTYESAMADIDNADFTTWAWDSDSNTSVIVSGHIRNDLHIMFVDGDIHMHWNEIREGIFTEYDNDNPELRLERARDIMRTNAETLAPAFDLDLEDVSITELPYLMSDLTDLFIKLMTP